jgi:hypothetical protein
LFLNEQDELGNWEIRTNLLAPFKDCEGAWFAEVSPDGKTVVWLRYTRNDNQTIIRSDFMFTRFLNGKWTTPEVLVAGFGEVMLFPQIKDAKLSNKNFVFSDYSGQDYIMPKLDGSGLLQKIEL